jgi:hypothetical protein
VKSEIRRQVRGLSAQPQRVYATSDNLYFINIHIAGLEIYPMLFLYQLQVVHLDVRILLLNNLVIDPFEKPAKQAVVSCLERNFETTKQSKTHISVLLSSSTGTSLYFYLDGIWAAPHGSEFNPVPCHFVFLA